MDRLTTSAALAAVLVSFALAGCGGNNTAATTDTPVTIQGVSTPPPVSVVTPKNAD